MSAPRTKRAFLQRTVGRGIEAGALPFREFQQCRECTARRCLALGIQVELAGCVSLGIDPESVAKALQRCNVQLGFDDCVAPARKRARYTERGGWSGNTFSEREFANVQVVERNTPVASA